MEKKLLIILLIIPITTILAQLDREYVDSGNHVLRINNRGELSCEWHDAENKLNKRSENLNYTLVRSTNDTNLVRDGLKILLRATDQLMANSEALLAFRRAAAIWERHLKVDITAIIDVDFGVLRFGVPWGEGVLGSTSGADYWPTPGGPGQYQNVQDYVNRVKNIHSDDPQLIELYNNIPIPTPTTTGQPFERLRGTFIQLQSLGYLEQHANPLDYDFAAYYVPVIGFNANFDWDLNPNDGIDNGQFDFNAVVIHEIGHALGFIGISFYGDDSYNQFFPWDLFRVRPDAVEVGSLTGFSTAERVATPGPPDSEPWPNEPNYLLGTHAFFDGLNEWECSTALYNRTQGDGQQSAHWRDDVLRPPSLGEDRYIGIMDPTYNIGITEVLHYSDLRMLEVTGYPILYNPPYADILITVDGLINDISFIGDTLIFGDIELNSLAEKTISISNTNMNNSLIYQVEIEKVLSFPEELDVEINTNKISSLILPDSTDDLILTVGNSSIPAIYYGTLRLHTNADSLLVIEIPFEFNIGGAVAPTIQISSNDLGLLKVESPEDNPIVSASFEISNSGTLPLEYRVITSLSARNTKPSGLLKSANKNNRVLELFYKKSFLKNSQTLYETDFETDFGGFTPAGDYIEDWNRTELGKAALEGHSLPTAVYYGSIDSMKYKHLGNAALVGPPIDVSELPTSDMVVFAFNYYLGTEVGYDFAFVDVSLDGGSTFEEIATSNGGIIMDTSSVWRAVLIELPFVSGNPEPIVFRFRFESDQLLNEEGFYIDDISLTSIEGANSIYTTPRSGILANQIDSEEIELTVNFENIEGGYFTGSALVLSNDFKNPEKGVEFALHKLFVDKVVYNKLYASTGRASSSKGKIIEIDPITGVGTVIGSSGFEPVSSITVNTNTEELYALSNRTGQPTNGIKISANTGGAIFKFETPVALVGVAFDDKDNTLYGIGSNNILYTVNESNGELTEIGDVGIKIAAITFNPFTNQLWASVKENSEKDRIYKIDKLSGDTTRVGQTGFNQRVEALTFDSEENLLGVQGSEQQISTLIRINQSSGVGEKIGSIEFRGVLGLAFAHDPITYYEETVHKEIPSKFHLGNNYPNPFNPSTTISYSLPEISNVTIKIYNTLGELVATLNQGVKEAGHHKVTWEAKVSSGIYFYTMNAIHPFSGSEEVFVDTKKMILLK